MGGEGQFFVWWHFEPSSHLRGKVPILEAFFQRSALAWQDDASNPGRRPTICSSGQLAPSECEVNKAITRNCAGQQSDS
jgi:hypothetical protein